MRFDTKQHRYYCGIDLHEPLRFRNKARAELPPGAMSISRRGFFRQRSILPLTTGGLIGHRG